MKITFLGANHEVTGSCTMIESNGLYGLVDCGMEQGKDIFENQEIPINPSNLDFVLLTHAHVDHSGLIPLLCKNGFHGRIYATEETVNLCSIMLLDCAHIQMQEAKWKTRKAARAGEKPVNPIYDVNDAQSAIHMLCPCPLDKRIQISETIEIRFVNAGHLLGSASIEIWITEKDVTKKIVFSGDLGNMNMPILRDMDYIAEADYAVIESTYGDRLHEHVGEYKQFLADCIQKTLDRKGNLLIPAFAVGRTQEMLYLIREIKNEGLIHDHDGFKVYIDSPLAIEATGIFLQCNEYCLDDETKELVKNGINPLTFDGLRYAVSSEESQQINFDAEPKVIISASGMCEAGRIRHHLKHNLWRKESLVLFVGYQAAGTLGRSLLDGTLEHVKLFGEEVAVNAEIAFMPGKSGHADQKGLLNWLSHFEKKPAHLFVNHGEDSSSMHFAELVKDTFQIPVSVPFSGSIFNLQTGVYEYEAEPVLVTHPQKSAGASRQSALFEKLLEAGTRLLDIIKKSQGLSNKDLSKFISQIQSLCDKWQS